MSINGILKLQELEGLRLKPYLDAGGKLTIGYGHLILPGEYFSPSGITNEQAHELFVHDLAPFVNRINKYVTVPLTQSQFDALVMWDFNTGKAHESQLIRMINAGSPINEVNDWWSNHYLTASGNYVPGLKKRRVYEASLFSGSSASTNVFPPLETIALGALVVYGIYRALK